MPSIDELRNRQANNLDNLRNKVEEEKNGGGGGQQDERFWKPPFDQESGKGFAIIRFLPAPPGEELPWVKLFRHSFQGPTGKRYFENCLTTIGKTDPVGELNRRLWNSGVESDKSHASKQKRQTTYFSNILVIDDKANPENNGKVFLFRYGPKIYEFIENAMYPQFEGETAINPFDPWEGANFQMKMTGQQLGDRVVPNYDKSSFAAPSAIGSDEEIERVWNQCYSLAELVDSEKAFKSYDELRRRLFEVLGPTVGSGVSVVEGWESAAPASNNQQQQPQQEPAQHQETPKQEADDDDVPWGPSDDSNNDSGSDSDLDSDMAFFEELTKDG